MKKLEYRAIPSEDNYEKYRESLREDSEYSCSYCTISESESPGGTFNIDHFRPIKHFPHLETKYENLRYSCPRCNSYKRCKWILNENGCIRDCIMCNTKVCNENIPRFINNLQEDPLNYMKLDDDILIAIDNYKPAEFTINYLRLNRSQLVKIRSTRRFIDLWKHDLLEMLERATHQINHIEQQYDEFKTINMQAGCVLDNSNEQLLYKIAAIQFDMLLLQAYHYKKFIEAELHKLEYIENKRYGADSANIKLFS
jgi:uncharacterized protein (TIGR02646 family)